MQFRVDYYIDSHMAQVGSLIVNNWFSLNANLIGNCTRGDSNILPQLFTPDGYYFTDLLLFQLATLNVLTGFPSFASTFALELRNNYCGSGSLFSLLSLCTILTCQSLRSQSGGEETQHQIDSRIATTESPNGPPPGFPSLHFQLSDPVPPNWNLFH